VLSYFSGKLAQSRVLFAEFVADKSTEGHRKEFYGKGSIVSRVIGKNHFVEEVLGQAKSLPVCKPSLELMLEDVITL